MGFGIALAAKAAGAMVAGTLVYSSGGNMLQTYKATTVNGQDMTALASVPTLPATSSEVASEEFLATECSVTDIVEKLQDLTREELLTAFLHCPGPLTLEDIEGEWNGMLLDNNGFLMTGVSQILTHVLFGRGRTWNGKTFGSSRKGINRFYPAHTVDGSHEMSGMASEHTFDYVLAKSSLQLNGNDVDDVSTEEKAVVLDYSRHQGFLSLWRTMKDEVRVVVPGKVLLGLGYMKWSGGVWNASPFVLWRADMTEEEGTKSFTTYSTARQHSHEG